MIHAFSFGSVQSVIYLLISFDANDASSSIVLAKDDSRGHFGLSPHDFIAFLYFFTMTASHIHFLSDFFHTKVQALSLRQ